MKLFTYSGGGQSAILLTYIYIYITVAQASAGYIAGLYVCLVSLHAITADEFLLHAGTTTCTH